eukprot:gene15980-22111_t
MSSYEQGKNWTASGGQFLNGNGEPIANPSAYFGAVAANTHGYNESYQNGHGQEIGAAGRSAYYQAVAADKYGYNGVASKGGK